MVAVGAGEIHVYRTRAPFHEPRALRTPNGKPYLPDSPIRFNVSHSHQLTLIAVTYEVEVGVDLERIRALPDYRAIAERYFPPGEAALTGEIDFFRRWTRFEAVLKAQGVGLYGAGAPLEGEWTIADLDVAEGYAAAVAAPRAAMTVRLHDFGVEP